VSVAFDVPVQALRRRKRTTSMVRFARGRLRADREEYADEIAELDATRPTTWGECQARGLGTTRPCVYLACAWHLALDASDDNGSITENFPGLTVAQMPATCTLAVATATPGLVLEEVARRMNLTRERARQIEMVAIAKAGGELVEAGTRAAKARCAASRPGTTRCGR
jgi:hypothetical protein